MAKTITTQDGEVDVVSSDAPTVTSSTTDVAYSNPLDAKRAAEAKQSGAEEVFRGADWSELPNYYCPICPFATLDGDAAIIAHGTTRHPGVNLKELVTTNG